MNTAVFNYYWIMSGAHSRLRKHAPNNTPDREDFKKCVLGEKVEYLTKKIGNSGTKGRTTGTRHTQKACNSNERRVLAVFFHLTKKI
jgi:hypothetical protein